MPHKQKIKYLNVKMCRVLGQVSALGMVHIEDKEEAKAFHDTLKMAKESVLEVIKDLKELAD